MAYADLLGLTGLRLTVSPLESRRFGWEVARLLLGTGVTRSDVDTSLAGTVADVVVVRYDGGRVDAPALLARAGWDVVACSPLTYWRLPVGRGKAPQLVSGLTTAGRDQLLAERPAKDLMALVDAVVASSFAGYGSHYASNPLLDAAAALLGYQEWARSAVLADRGEVLVLSRKGEPVALATLAVEADRVEVLLAGVVAGAQGHGLYAHLLSAAERVALELEVPELVISTQTHNTGVQRAWARYGLEPVSTVATAHLVREGLLERLP